MKIYKKKKQLIVLSFILTFFVLMLLSPKRVTSFEPSILSITHQPTTVSQNTNITITVIFGNDENVTSVRILYCSIEPEYQCHIPQIDMINTVTNTWIGSFIVLEESGKIGYQIHIDHSDGSMVAPNSSDYLGYENIIETHVDIFYFSIQLTTITETAPLNIGVPSILLAYLVFVIIRYKKDKK